MKSNERGVTIHLSLHTHALFDILVSIYNYLSFLFILLIPFSYRKLGMALKWKNLVIASGGMPLQALFIVYFALKNYNY